MTDRLSLIFVLVSAVPAGFFGVVSALDSLSHRTAGRAFTSSSFLGGVVGLLALLAGMCSPITTTLGWILALRGLRKSRRVERLIAVVSLGLASIATAYFLTAYILPIVMAAIVGLQSSRR